MATDDKKHAASLSLALRLATLRCTTIIPTHVPGCATRLLGPPGLGFSVPPPPPPATTGANVGANVVVKKVLRMIRIRGLTNDPCQRYLLYPDLIEPNLTRINESPDNTNYFYFCASFKIFTIGFTEPINRKVLFKL